MFITQQQGNDQLMCLMKAFRTYSGYNDPHLNSPFCHLFSPKSSGFYVPLRNIPERALHLRDTRTFHYPLPVLYNYTYSETTFVLCGANIVCKSSSETMHLNARPLCFFGKW